MNNLTPIASGGEAAEKPSVFLEIHTIQDFEPLDDQFGVASPKPVPDALETTLFADNESERPDQALKTYAILDGARIAHLPEKLEATDLKHQCLFKGDAKETLGSLGPWLVELSKDAALTRQLFTKGDAPVHLWGKDPGFFIQTKADFKSLWSHLRKFTRVQDETGKWFLLRFWDPAIATAYFSSFKENRERVAQWFQIANSEQLAFLIPSAKPTALHVLKPNGVFNTNHPFKLNMEDRRVFKQQRWLRFLARVAKMSANHHPQFSALSFDDQIMRCHEYATSAYQHGISVEKAVADWTLAMVLSEGTLLRDPKCQNILQKNNHQLDKASAILSAVQSRSKIAL